MNVNVTKCLHNVGVIHEDGDWTVQDFSYFVSCGILLDEMVRFYYLPQEESIFRYLLSVRQHIADVLITFIWADNEDLARYIISFGVSKNNLYALKRLQIYGSHKVAKILEDHIYS